MRWKRRPEFVQAEQYDPDGDPVVGVVGKGVWTELGFQPIRLGDWVVTWPDGKRRVYSDTYFRSAFELDE